ncbi:MAG: hypothetical protein KKF12_18505 [Proteobacteria bacterium]|nr:hypothetical protein [Desulfobacula sp.]MBU3952968.1 hypothetical protein [Pseudomonadota bacterium]MBU4132813.1 hypothetical protein [Pseudomonadota bacterium]
MRLSKHFIDNWYERVGNYPTEEMIKGIILDSVVIQKGLKLKKLDNTPFNTLTNYWHPDLKLILRIDCFTNTAVSVLTPENMPKPHKRQTPVNYTPMTMHNY